MSVVVGIDLGTTNSSIAVFEGDQPVLVAVDDSVLMPSVVGIAPDGTVLVGHEARNQRQVYPERTIASVKRRMGEMVDLPMGDETYTPVEISAMILRRLRAAAEAHIGGPVRRAVITVPAYFSDAQRTATREAGEMAGLVVERVFNEPTAAALTTRDVQRGDFLVYDLGGGTFDVSVVRIRDEITEVLASHGDTHLGGDDFDGLVVDHLRIFFESMTGADLTGNLRALARLDRAAEAARIGLSAQPFVQVTEPNLAEVDGVPVHLDIELARDTLERLIEPLLLRTMDSVAIALNEAGVVAEQLDHVLLVGGVSQTPLISTMLTARLGQMPRMSVDPTYAVSLGAGLQAARLEGRSTSGILVDVTPFSFGTSHTGTLDGEASDDCYAVIIQRNAALPCKRSEVFYTVHDGQEVVDVEIYQGEAPYAQENILLGDFVVEGLDPHAAEESPIVFELGVDLSGILSVTVIEQHTGLRKDVVIKDAFRTLDADEMRSAQDRLSTRMGFTEVPVAPVAVAVAPVRFAAPAALAEADQVAWDTAVALFLRAESMAPGLEGEDADEIDDLLADLGDSLETGDLEDVRAISTMLADVLFYLD
jgi:molecular chaperone DnaK (HSP70)